MTITAKIIADSIGEYSPRLTTLQLKYPKFIHGEFLTHRVLSRNSSSSRAIPVKRLIQDIMDDPVIPIHWGANQKGMQADKECNEEVIVPILTNIPIIQTLKLNSGLGRQEAWLQAMYRAIEVAQAFDVAGYHKQIVNRIIEPWSHINTVVTATEWSNFFALRRHKDAQPEMHALADAIWGAMKESKPRFLYHGDWHIPYIQNAGPMQPNAPEVKVSVARCARVSYLTQEGKPPKIEDDLALYDRLVGSKPLHASPCEHQATPDIWTKSPSEDIGWFEHPELHGNLSGYIQFRKTLPEESQ